MKRYALILCAVLALVSCTKEKEVTYSHPVDAEFGADASHKTDAVLYADLSMMGEAEIKNAIATYPADLALLQLPASVGSVSAGEWLESVRSELGYSTISVVNETSLSFAALSKLNTTTFDSYQMAESKALEVEYGDYYFLVAKPTAGDVTYVANNVAKTSGSNVLLFFQLDGPSAEIEGMVYTDCIDAQYGESAFPSRTDYLYAAPGVWNRMSAISLDPVRFTIFSEEK